MLWTYQTSYKVTIGQTPFQLMYKQEAVVLAEFMVPSLQIAIHNKFGNMDSLRERLYNLDKIDEKRAMVQWATDVHNSGGKCGTTSTSDECSSHLDS